VRVADLRSPLRRPLREGDRTALTGAGGQKIRTGDMEVFLRPVAFAPAVVRRDGRVQADGHPADHARLGVIEQRLDAMAGQPGVIGQVAAETVPRGKVKGSARRSMTMAAALLMTLMPEADYGEVLQALFGDLALLPWHVPFAVPTDTVLATRLAVLGDVGIIGGRSSAEVSGAPGSMLANRLTGHLEREIMLRWSRGGPLTPPTASSTLT